MMWYVSPVVVPCARAVVWLLLTKPDTSTFVMSHPCRAPTDGVPGVWFSVPNVPDVSSAPSSPAICEEKKLFAGLRGPSTLLAGVSGVFDPKSILSAVVRASPSIAVTARRPDTTPDVGVQNPDTDATAPSAGSNPRNSVMLRIGRLKSSWTTASVHPAAGLPLSVVPCVAGTRAAPYVPGPAAATSVVTSAVRT